MLEISKEFEGDFGHRVWNQNLDSEFACTTQCKCKALHGHRFKIVPVIARKGGGIKDNMVTDFSHLATFKNWVDRVLDHKLLMDINDPELHVLFPRLKQPFPFKEMTNDYVYGTSVSKEGYKTESEIALYSGLVVVNFVPTAENIATWIAEKILPELLPKELWVKELYFYETPKSFAKWTNI